MISLNHNFSAANTANNLTSHYGRLQTSTQRLSSGLRINGASDDAAGLAIRELMRADIAAYRQGMRNVNDAISMIQTFDGALGIIDEKLIRMKELAEQAATGTYNSTQRLMIDSEFQAMGAEINRIARATDFNGIKLLDGAENDGNLAGADAQKSGKIIGRAAITDTVEVGGKKYEITFDPLLTNAQVGATVTEAGWDLSGLTDPAKLVGSTTIDIVNDGAIKFGDQYLMVTPQGFPSVPVDTDLTISYDPAQPSPSDWTITSSTGPVTVTNGGNNMCMFTLGGGVYVINVFDPATNQAANLTSPVGPTTWTAPANNNSYTTSGLTNNNGVFTKISPTATTASMAGNTLTMTIDLGNNNKLTNSWTITGGNELAITDISIKLDIKDVTPPPTPPTPPGPNDPNNPGGNGGSGNGAGGLPDLFTDKVKIHFGPGNDSAEDYYYINKHDATLRGLGLEGVEIQKQAEAQDALVKIDEAIEAKDKIRAEYGAMQNRLENTFSNLSIQAENLQAAESRISDTDVALEMMMFVRNQILTQSAVAMLSQANSMPQMVMSLIK